MYAPPPQRMVDAYDARIRKGLPTRPLREFIKVRGLLQCRNNACTVGLVHRDYDACRVVMKNEYSKDAGMGTIECMQHYKRAKKPPPPRTYLRHVVGEGEGGEGGDALVI